jgi:cyclohexanone monooxygenase
MDSSEQGTAPSLIGVMPPKPGDVVGRVTGSEQDEIRAKFAAERARRLRSDGTSQFSFAEGALGDFDKDPHAGQITDRDPFTDELDVLVIGGGFGGIQAAIWLQRAGVEDFRIVDVAGDFGGTWYWNRYPGLRCDTQSYIYLPMLEETRFMPAERYTTGSEILQYSSLLAKQFGLYDKAVFHTRVTGMKWHESERRWRVTTDRGDELRAKFVTTQSGIFNRPQLPGIRGIEDFEGHAFHTARWDYEYTGGERTGQLSGLADKRVAVFGTGTTALQVVPELAKHAKQLTVFQRTPTSVGFRENGPTDPKWFESLEPGWQQKWIEAFNLICSGARVEAAPIDDGWTRYFDHLNESVDRVPVDEQTPELLEKVIEAADFEWNKMLRARVDALVEDETIADGLKAYYRTLCKRLGFSDEYLQVFNQDNVDLVETLTAQDLTIVPKGVEFNGALTEFDCIIFATGFEIGTSWVHQAKYDPIGRDGLKLSDAWADGIKTFYGFHAEGFPNLILLGMTQTATTLNVPHMLQQQVRHVSALIAECLEQGIEAIDATHEAVENWQAVMAEKNAQRLSFIEACTPGYLNAEGKGPADGTSALASGVYHPSYEFWEILEGWRKAHNFAGLRVDRAAGGS